jgi:hypothetical protein
MGVNWILTGLWVQDRRLDRQSLKATFGPQPPFGQREVHWGSYSPSMWIRSPRCLALVGADGDTGGVAKTCKLLPTYGD